MTCPQCKAQHPIGDSKVESFPLNTYVLQIIKLLKECGLEEKYFEEDNKTLEKCTVHNRELGLYCQNSLCQKAICQKCYIEFHSMHDIIDVDEKDQQELIKAADNVLKKIQLRMLDVKTYNQIVKKENAKIKQSLENQKSWQIAQVSEMVKHHKATMKNSSDMYANKVRDIIISLDTSLGALHDMRHSTVTYSNQANMIEILQGITDNVTTTSQEFANLKVPQYKCPNKETRKFLAESLCGKFEEIAAPYSQKLEEVAGIDLIIGTDSKNKVAKNNLELEGTSTCNLLQEDNTMNKKQEKLSMGNKTQEGVDNQAKGDMGNKIKESSEDQVQAGMGNQEQEGINNHEEDSVENQPQGGSGNQGEEAVENQVQGGSGNQGEETVENQAQDVSGNQGEEAVENRIQDNSGNQAQEEDPICNENQEQTSMGNHMQEEYVMNKKAQEKGSMSKLVQGGSLKINLVLEDSSLSTTVQGGSVSNQGKQNNSMTKWKEVQEGSQCNQGVFISNHDSTTCTQQLGYSAMNNLEQEDNEQCSDEIEIHGQKEIEQIRNNQAEVAINTQQDKEGSNKDPEQKGLNNHEELGKSAIKNLKELQSKEFVKTLKEQSKTTNEMPKQNKVSSYESEFDEKLQIELEQSQKQKEAQLPGGNDPSASNYCDATDEDQRILTSSLGMYVSACYIHLLF